MTWPGEISLWLCETREVLHRVTTNKDNRSKPEGAKKISAQDSPRGGW
jgi:hypothetical protein